MKHYEKRRSVSGRLFILMLALVLVLTQPAAAAENYFFCV